MPVAVGPMHTYPVRATLLVLALLAGSCDETAQPVEAGESNKCVPDSGTTCFRDPGGAGVEFCPTRHWRMRNPTEYPE